MTLSLYKKKRDFKKTSEPAGSISTASKLRFVIQRHHASRIHYDFRLEMGGVLKSWAVPKGPSLNPTAKRLAMLVEDHPVDYIDFAGVIPQGNYGAGTVEIWDSGTYTPINEKGETITEKQALGLFKKGSVKVALKGKKLKGEFALVMLKKDNGKSWLLIKHRDANAVDTDYNSEDYSKHKKKEDKAGAAEKPAAIKKKGPEKVVFSRSKLAGKKISNYITPMLAAVGDKAFDSADWLFELKLDGYRAIAEINEQEVLLYSRNGLSFSGRYPVVFNELKKMKHRAVLDGEIVVLDEAGKADFQKLQHYETFANYPVVYYVFDLLMLDGHDTKELQLTQRKELLKDLIGSNDIIRYCDHIETNGIDFFEQVISQQLEGIIAKKKESSYHPGVRSKDWLKIKNIQTHEAVIAGYTSPRGSRQHFGALILGKYDGSELKYIGHTGTGFSAQLLQELWNAMQPLIAKSSPFKEKIKVNAPVTWLRPKLVAELNFTEMTVDKMMRHPVFVRLRHDKDPGEITVDKPPNKTIMAKAKKTSDSTENKQQVKKQSGSQSNERTITSGSKRLELTNLNKIFWPEEGYTKGDLINYYEKAADYILPYLKNRPLSLKRNPNGIADEGFYHKDAGEAAPAWVKHADLFSDSADKIIHYIICNDKLTLLYLANLGCIELNPWNSTTTKLENPSYLVIDIDPADKNTFNQVIETAQVVKDVLGKASADCYCKTSGASGLHVYIPLGNRYDYDLAKEFAHIVASLVQEQLPAFTSLERNLKKRGNNIYIDFLQNRTGQTLAATYSVRPKKGATVSTPLEWDEVKPGLHPSQFNINNILERIEEKGDLFKPVLDKGISLQKCLRLLEK